MIDDEKEFSMSQGKILQLAEANRKQNNRKNQSVKDRNCMIKYNCEIV